MTKGKVRETVFQSSTFVQYTMDRQTSCLLSWISLNMISGLRWIFNFKLSVNTMLVVIKIIERWDNPSLNIWRGFRNVWEKKNA